MSQPFLKKHCLVLLREVKMTVKTSQRFPPVCTFGSTVKYSQLTDFDLYRHIVLANKVQEG